MSDHKRGCPGREYVCTCGYDDQSDWQLIETFLAADAKGPWTSQYLLAHAERKWRRFGRYDLTLKRWYYSGTDERSQWSQIEGDAPTHWMHIPDLPK